MRSLEGRSNKQLEKLIIGIRKTKKLLQPTVQVIDIKYWKVHAVLDRLDSSSSYARRIIGLRKIGRCKATVIVARSFYTTYRCAARERKPHYSKELMAKELCSSCRYTPQQAKMRKVMLTIKNGGQNNGQ